MSALDLSPFDNEEMDIIVERTCLLQDTYQKTVLTAFVVDKVVPIEYLGNLFRPWIRSKYLDLSDCQRGDYDLFCEHLNQFKYDGLLIDNIDQIRNNEDREYWEAFVRFALKREDEFQPLPFGDSLYFSKMHIAVRCKEYPEYLMGKSLQCVIIGEEYNNRFLSDEDVI